MVLTPEQIAAITQIIRDGSTAVAIRTSGYRVTQSEFARLKAEGYLPEDLSYADMVEASYRLGQAMQRNPAAKDWSYQELGAFLRKEATPLSSAERTAVDIARQRAGTFCVGLGNTYSSELGRVVVDADQALAERTRAGIREETSRAIAERATVKQLKSRLGHMTEDWARDWDRIAITETHQAHQEGLVDSIVSRKGSEVGMAKIPEPDACFIGETLVLTDRGHIPIEAVRVGDLVVTHKLRWRRVTRVFRRPYNGTLYGFNGRPARATANHPFLASMDWKRADAVKRGDEVVKIRWSADSQDQPPLAAQQRFFDGIPVSRFPGEVPAATVQLYCNLQRRNSDIDVKWADCQFRYGIPFLQRLKHVASFIRHTCLIALAGLRNFSASLWCSRLGTSDPGGFSQFQSIGWVHQLHADPLGFERGARFVAEHSQSFSDGVGGHAIACSQFLRGRSPLVETRHFGLVMNGGKWAGHGAVITACAEKVNSVATGSYEGEVFNLEVDEDRSYFADGLAAHNCSACRELYLENGKPRVRPASWWMANGTSNVGRKRPDWKAVLGAAHAHCRCQMVEVPEGWGFDDAWNLVPLDEDEAEKSLDKKRTKPGQGYRDQLPGGRADRMLPAQFNAADLGEGTAHELEHTRDRKLAREIAMDHLAEDPKYYKKLRKLEKAGQGGPFIGPRGGKWADPQHTIPWEETKPAAVETKPVSDPLAEGTVHTLPAGVFGRDQATQFQVKGTKDGTVAIAETWDGKHGPSIVMPAASLRHFVNDLSGKVDLPATSDNTLVNDVINGKGTLLGKGDDGVVFQVGDHVVKMSTTVPYQPMNPGHRTPDEAADMLEKQVEVGNKLHEVGVPGIQQSLFVQHGDKGFQIKPFVTIPEKLTREQLDAAQSSILAMHEKGYALRDSVQVGLDAAGNAVLFDIGKAAPYKADKKETMGKYAGMPFEVAHDLESLEYLYRDHGQTFVHRDRTAGEHKAQIALGMSDKTPASPIVQMNLEFALKTLAAEIAALPEGPQRSRLEATRQRVEDEHGFVSDAVAAAKKDAKLVKAEPYEERLVKARKLHGRMKFQGFDISIENRKGSIRHWHNVETGKDGQTVMKHPYGYIRRTVGADGDHVDVFVGPHADAKNVYVVRTMKAPDFKLPDEDKCFVGFKSAADAKRSYLDHYDNPAFFGSMQTLPLEEFRRKVYAADGELIKAGIKLTEWLWAVDHAGIPFSEFGGVVARAKAGEAGDRAKLDEVYAYLSKAGATESLYVDAGLDTAIIGGMGAQASRKRVRGPNTGEPYTSWPMGRDDAKVRGRRPKRLLLRGRERFDLKGKHTADTSWVRPVHGFAGVVSMEVARPEIDSAQSHAGLKAPQESRAALHRSGKLQTIHRGTKQT